MFTHRNTKPVLHHIHRAIGQFHSVEKIIKLNKPLEVVHTQLCAASKSANNCYEKTFRTLLAEQLAKALVYRMKTPGIAQDEYDHLRDTSRNIAKLSTKQIFAQLSRLRFY